VLVEAHRAGARALGLDLSPLAVLVARAKCAVDEPLEAVVTRARAIAERVIAEGRAARRAGGPRGRRLPDEVWRAFPPHVAAELAALREAAEAEAESLRAPLLAILSSILVKVSRRESDTSAEAAVRLVARGAAARLFATRAEERAQGLRDLARRAPRGTPVPDVRVGDARRLGVIGAGSVAAVLTSPPYPGTYDYVEQHALRLAFLGMDARGLEAGELGARRRFAAGRSEAALLEWERDMTAVLRGLARVLAPGGAIAMVIGDSRVGQAGEARAVFADEVVGRLAPPAGLRVVAAASQRRTALGEAEGRAFARRPKREHLLYLARG
jgi:SAM-dependent methyltransferase